MTSPAPCISWTNFARRTSRATALTRTLSLHLRATFVDWPRDPAADDEGHAVHTGAHVPDALDRDAPQQRGWTRTRQFGAQARASQLEVPRWARAMARNRCIGIVDVLRAAVRVQRVMERGESRCSKAPVARGHTSTSERRWRTGCTRAVGDLGHHAALTSCPSSRWRAQRVVATPLLL